VGGTASTTDNGVGVVGGRWSGTLGVRPVERSLNGVVEGKMTVSRRRGWCELRGSVPNLWPWIVGSLGFDIDCVRYGNDANFASLLHDRHGRPIKAVDGGRYRPLTTILCHRLHLQRIGLLGASHMSYMLPAGHFTRLRVGCGLAIT
jgi:hypothetical protein